MIEIAIHVATDSPVSWSFAVHHAGDDRGQQREGDPHDEVAQVGPPRGASLPEHVLALEELHGGKPS